MEDGLFAIVDVIPKFQGLGSMAVLSSENGIGMLSFNMQVSEQWSCRCDP